MPTLTPNVLSDFSARIFRACGVPEEDARIVAESLVGANLRGHDSHGVMRVTQYVGYLRGGQYRVGVPLLIESETPAVVVADGQWGFGQIQAHRLLDRIFPKAKALGVAVGTARHCGHAGRLGEYAERAAAEGMVLLGTVNNDGAAQRVAPPGGIAPRLATNPLVASVPLPGADPLVVDFGTSAVSEGKVRTYYLDARKPVPEGWLLDCQGTPTCDPGVLYEAPTGTIRPMGGSQAYKGFGLGLVLDLLAGGLTGGNSAYPDPPPTVGNNIFFAVFDPAKFAGAEHLAAQADRCVGYVRSTPTAPGVSGITLPGDPERSVKEARAAGGIPLPEGHWAKLTELAAELGVEVPSA